MPRARKPGPANNNRTDLNVPKPAILPIGQPNGVAPSIATGMPYGEHQRLQQMEQAQPLTDPGAIPAAPAAPSAPSAPPVPPDMNQAVNEAGAMPSTAQGILNAPSNRPNEPLTAGMPIGPGPGPEVLPQWAQGMPTPQTAAASTLGRLASIPNAGKDIQVLAAFAKQASS